MIIQPAPVNNSGVKLLEVRRAHYCITKIIVDMKQKKVDLFQFVDREKVREALRPALCFVYHDPETCEAVATDAHMLAASKQDYNPDLAGKLISRFGDVYNNEQEIEIPYKTRFGEKIMKTTLRYPNHMSVRPCKELYEKVENFSIDKLKAAIKLCRELEKESTAIYLVEIAGSLIRVDQAKKIVRLYTPDMTISRSKQEENYRSFPIVFESKDIYILCTTVNERGFKRVDGYLYAKE